MPLRSILILCATSAVCAQPRVQYVTVDNGVRLEVLDWGGSGRAVFLLAGSGNTAHVFDDFAPKLTGSGHLFGITRRGFGASSQPESGYGEQRLADDILRVIESLGIQSPVLVGHSMAGGEMTILGAQHSDRLGGLVYLDALFDVGDYPASDPAYMALFKKLPPSNRPPPPPPTEEETRSFAGYRARQMRNEGFAFPESELRNGSVVNADGTKGTYKTPQRIFKAIGDGAIKRDYSRIRVPVLSINAIPEAIEPGEEPQNEEDRATVKAFRDATIAFLERWKSNLRRGVPDARFVDLLGAGHYLFFTREAEVLRELKSFVAALQSATNPPAFEVASVKASSSIMGRDGKITTNPGRLTAMNATLKSLLHEAWQIPYGQITGPAWLDSNEYDIDAKAANPTTPQHLRQMLRTLLIDRFKLSVHTETKEQRVYALVAGKGGPKLDGAEKAGSGLWRFHGDLAAFASVLSIQLTIPLLSDPTTPSHASGPAVPVVDKTGIEGVYDISIAVKPDGVSDTFTVWQRALQDRLGLKLESQRASVEFLIIDHADKIPTGN